MPITDKGHLKLIVALRELLAEAEKGEFHDFANQNYAAPKMALAGKLAQLRENVIKGDYYNDPRPGK